MRIGVLGALPEEVAAVAALVAGPDTVTRGGRAFITGTAGAHRLVVTHSRIGKVAAATASVELIARFEVDQILFVGVAGALSPALSPGDIVVADRLIQHDLDASPLFPAMEIPLTGRSFIETSRAIADALDLAARAFVAEEHPALVNGDKPRVHRGDVATGDRFIADPAARDAVRRRVPSALCVEMEGAAVAQVCCEYDVPLGVARVISDAADDLAAHHFAGALEQFAGACAGGVIRRYLGSS